ncbi:MAG: 2,3-bisphosphoglycerate-independent phosphoglycerate mutase [Bdellovibrionales bacterium]
MNKAFLIILDGFGYSEEKKHNAISLAETPYIDSLLEKYPNTKVQTSGKAVGLPDGVMGNSEVGHLTIGSGRVHKQDLTRISEFFETDEAYAHKLIDETAKSNKVLHLLGLLSDGGVHSHMSHLISLVKVISKLNPKKEIVLHAITDGRDTDPEKGASYVEEVLSKLSTYSNFSLSTVIGRFFAMDRDQRWDRVEKAYSLMVNGIGLETESVTDQMRDSYGRGITDEFLEPVKIKGSKSIDSNSELLFFNFRADRAREIVSAFCDDSFSEFETKVKLAWSQLYSFTQYKESFKNKVLFPKESPKKILGELVSQEGGKQLRIAETEKYAHITYFLNGGNESIFPQEDRIMVDSPKDIKTYDEKPEMSAFEVTEKLESALREDKYNLIVVNYANGDMVGHTGVEKAAIVAVETLDKCLSRVVEAAVENGYEVLITADHGNCEQMVDPVTGKAFTQHTTNAVPLIWAGKRALKNSQLEEGGLSDLAPSMLYLLGIKQPTEMTGRNLLSEG